MNKQYQKTMYILNIKCFHHSQSFTKPIQNDNIKYTNNIIVNTWVFSQSAITTITSVSFEYIRWVKEVVLIAHVLPASTMDNSSQLINGLFEFQYLNFLVFEFLVDELFVTLILSHPTIEYSNSLLQYFVVWW